MTSDNIDALIEEMGGCGRFQILLVIACWVAELSIAWSAMVMSFGSYNPGMECVTTDVETGTGITNGSIPIFRPMFFNLSLTGSEHPDLNTGSKNTTMQYQERNSTFAENVCDCPGEIKFKDSASTIVTEWSLVCDRVWISSIIISVQMAGALLGVPLGGQIAHRLGRKVAVYGCLALNAVLNFVAFFSVSWTMFAVLRFFMGISYGAASFVYCTEFLTHRWRGILASIPDWSISCVALSLVFMALRDWRNLHLTIGAVALLSCLPAFWAPESMRWLAVRGNVSKARKIAKKIATTNKKPEPNTDILMQECDNEHTEPHSYFDLFRGGLRKSSIVMGFVWFTLSVIFYTISFGVKALSGNFYINFLALNLVTIPAKFSGTFVVNRLGRRLSTIFYLSISAIASVGIVGVHFLVPTEFAGTITTVLAIICHTCVTTAWGMCMPWVVELYPTTIRTLAYSWVVFMAKIGGIVSPYMLPKSTVPVYGSFIIMGFLIICSILSLLSLPETKGKPLQDMVSRKKISVLPHKFEEEAEKPSNENAGADNTIIDSEGNKTLVIQQV